MIIGIDIDDTLTETFDHMIPCVAEYFGVSADELRQRNISYNNLPEEWKEEELKICKKYCDSIIEDTPFKTDAAWAMQKLHEQGHKIVIITARTTAFYSDPYKTTIKELANGGIVYDKLICTLDKASACTAEKVSLFVDDTIANCEAVSQVGIPVLVMNSKVNKSMETSFDRVSNWSEVLEKIADGEKK